MFMALGIANCDNKGGVDDEISVSGIDGTCHCQIGDHLDRKLYNISIPF